MQKVPASAALGWTSVRRSVLITGPTSQNSCLMSSPLLIDPALFDPSAISAETRAVNDEIVRRLNAEPTGLTIPEIRARRIAGIGAIPAAPKSLRAETMTIAGPSGPMEL